MKRLINPAKTYTFIPESEKEESAPLTFHVVAMDGRQKMIFSTSFTMGPDGSFTSIGSVIWDMLCANIRKIENVVWNGKSGPVTVDTRAQVRQFLMACGTDEAVKMAMEVAMYIKSLSEVSEAEAGN
jgi:hypothetical protein